MKNFHSITASVFVKEKENLEKIKSTFLDFFPFDLQKEKIKIEIKKATGFEKKIITIFTIKLEKQKHIKNFTEKLFEKLKKLQIEQILEELNTRIDEKGIFYIRFDKESWIKDKKLFIIDEGNCFHMKFKIAAYPLTKPKAKEIMQKIFKDI